MKYGVRTVNMQWSPPTTREDISGWCWIQIEIDPKNRWMHCNTFFTRVVWELDMRDLPCCNSPSFSMTSVADWNAFLSSSERSLIYSCIAFWNASLFTGTGIGGDCGFGDGFEGAGAGPARILELAAVLDPDMTLLGTVVPGALAGVLLEAGPGTEVGLGLGLLDFLRWNGAFSDLPNFRALSIVFPEDIFAWHVNCRTSVINSAGEYTHTWRISF